MEKECSVKYRIKKVVGKRTDNCVVNFFSSIVCAPRLHSWSHSFMTFLKGKKNEELLISRLFEESKIGVLIKKHVMLNIVVKVDLIIIRNKNANGTFRLLCWYLNYPIYFQYWWNYIIETFVSVVWFYKKHVLHVWNILTLTSECMRSKLTHPHKDQICKVLL